MRRFILFVMLLMLCTAGGQPELNAAESPKKYRVGEILQQSKPKADAEKKYQQVGWDALVPEGWDPMQAFKSMDLSRLNDSDPRAMDALEQLRRAWDTAPVEQGWNGRGIRIAGFVVPLERTQNRVTEFLLVPYFGACIHVPPPPANQIIHVTMEKPVTMSTMDAVWVTGTLRTTRTAAEKAKDDRTGMGSAGYRMVGVQITPYEPTK
jgi:hypothetical protein